MQITIPELLQNSDIVSNNTKRMLTITSDVTTWLNKFTLLTTKQFIIEAVDVK